ncbi:MAG: MarR family winged helix-turn-helix transcriptional regulator [Pseudomonadota bacterium]
MDEVNVAELDLLNLDDIPSSANILSIAIQRAARLLRADLNRVLMSHGDLGLVDFRLLRELSKVVVATQKSLINSIQLEQAQVSRSLASLEKRQLVSSCTYPKDRRVRLFTMEPKGRAAFDAVRPRVMAHNARLTAGLSQAEQAEVLQQLQSIVHKSAQSADTSELYDATS